jgi:hypothetical protein
MGLTSSSRANAFINNPALRLLLVFAFIFSLLLSYGKAHFYRDPLSIFYNPERAYTRQYSAFRQAQAENFIQEQIVHFENDHEQQTATKAREYPYICTSFATLKRHGVQYIENSVASALEGLTREERQDLYISVFFANSDPEVHPSYHVPWLRNLVDEVYIQPQADEDHMERIRDFESTSNYSAKGVLDYTFGLQHCYDNGAPYILMFEGDLIIADGWFAKTMDALRQTQRQTAEDTRWLYMRLFNQERSTGWASRRVGGNNEHWIIIGIVAVVLLLAAMFRRRPTTSNKAPEPWTLAVICLVIVPSLVILFFQAGKASILPPEPGVRQEKFGCCSQALLFDRDYVPGLIDYLQWREYGQVDLMVNTYAREHGFSRLSLYPVQVQHVGVESVRGTRKDEAQKIWSMAFEDKDPVRLRKEHDELVGQLYHSSDG